MSFARLEVPECRLGYYVYSFAVNDFSADDLQAQMDEEAEGSLETLLWQLVQPLWPNRFVDLEMLEPTEPTGPNNVFRVRFAIRMNDLPRVYPDKLALEMPISTDCPLEFVLDERGRDRLSIRDERQRQRAYRRGAQGADE